MTSQEIEHQNWKKNMRQEALEKELNRLRRNENRLLKKNSNFKKACIFLIFSFICIYLTLLITGAISFEKNTDTTSADNTLVIKNSALEDSIIFLNKKIDILIKAKTSAKEDEGYKFKVQFGAFKSQDLDQFNDNLVSLEQEKINDFNQYTLGSFNSYKKAQLFLKHMRSIGFKDSFIIATNNGEKVNIEDAIANTSSSN